MRVVRTPRWDSRDEAPLVTREWLVTNGRGGYASTTVAGVNTRRYHALLVAALPAPFGRRVMLNHLAETLALPDGRLAELGGREDRARLDLSGAPHLEAFRLEDGLPVWRFRTGEWLIERRVLMPHEQNTTHVSYRLLEGDDGARLLLRPALHFRGYEEPVDVPLRDDYAAAVDGAHCEIHGDRENTPLRLRMFGSHATLQADVRLERELVYRVEAGRGYQATGELWSPGYYDVPLQPDAPVTFVASVESWEEIDALEPAAAFEAEHRRRNHLLELAHVGGDTVAAELVLAADQFIITPTGRPRETARARAAGDEVRTVIAGYHWFTDWGRDTMISLEGLTLATRRFREAAYILRTFAHYVRDGLIPNMFPDGSTEGLYHTADATLWFFHALERYRRATGDDNTVRELRPVMEEIARAHLRGTHFGICVDPADGLLRQGAEGYQLTWMDAKVDGWVVTPRRGKAVEINALWYNALVLLAEWAEHFEGADAPEWRAHAERARTSFNARFWCESCHHLYDVVDGEEGDDAACRPNQVFAISLDHAVLERERWPAVLETVRERLLTPVGLRSLAPGHPDYKPAYYGDLRTRDGAYHQGTVWGWLIGPYVDAWLKVYPEDTDAARGALAGMIDHLDEFGVGSIAEIFDADPPFTPRGCIAQAWSIAETLRCWRRLSAG